MIYTYSDKEGVISVFESQVLKMHTTRSWDFMGLTLNSTRGTPLQLSRGDDIIVGLIDSGVWPESASFMEEPGMGPIPKSWKGQCIAGEQFDPKKACNRKLIGAQYYLAGFERRYGKINTSRDKDYRSARDFLGHGTHTASTAVGSRSSNASIFGFARGTARGGAPRARLAVYKACWNRNYDGDCMEEDVLAAFDAALNDGVNVISVSIGKPPPLRRFFESSSDIGSFHAMQLGVSVVFSAGNRGPDPSLVENVNPWSISVAASNMDRSFPTKILLANDGSYFVGESLIAKPISGVLARASSYFFSGVCTYGNWKGYPATGKILVCFSTDGSIDSEDAEYAAYKANATALIFVQPPTRPTAVVSIIPVIRIDTIQGSKLYQQSFNLTKVQILQSETTLQWSPAPVASYYSSRGPSSISPDFLKPDISAPGTNILAAWPLIQAPSVFDNDDRSVEWSFLSGTSMACPHVSGVVALLKSAHPTWSPAAIRSALMTTAYSRDDTGDSILAQGSTKPSNPFDIGAGHMNPVQAFDPGLIYDMTTQDYVLFLCNNGYSDEQIQAMVTCEPITACPKCADKKHKSDWSINYPSITVSDLKGPTSVGRTVRNVGPNKAATYRVRTVNPTGVSVVVWPKVLNFSSLNEEKRYCVTLQPVKISQPGRYGFGSIVWSDGVHEVRSPLVVQVNNDEV
ncbi:subtilisin-like protease sbt5.3 [Phtheirospermum japonicum]|uniref:Subtilisin-like protease sbt5.3 n=1 Tax=Phtheirospermum japonicum TaxID=374723 RepID=A0A830C916_9LAMI|nr:subtilisin-like protease sbt5.3 [Phtheirospermum japonicum]